MKKLVRILSVCTAAALLTSCVAAGSPGASSGPVSSPAASSDMGASGEASTSYPTPTAAPETTPPGSSTKEEMSAQEKEALIKEAEFLVDRLVGPTFGTVGGVKDVDALVDKIPYIFTLLPFVLALDWGGENPYAGYGQYSEDRSQLYMTEENIAALLYRVLGVDELPEEIRQYPDYNPELRRIEYATAVGLSNSYSYRDLVCTIDEAAGIVRARFILEDSGSYESNDVYGPYEIIFDICSDGETRYLRFRSELPV